MKPPLTDKYVTEQLKKEGFKKKSKYKNNKIPMELVCPVGHEFKMNYNNFHTGQRCNECYKIEKRKVAEKSLKKLKEEGYRLLRTYKNTKVLLKFACPEGHLWYTTFSNLCAGKRCGKCWSEDGMYDLYESKRLKNLKYDAIRKDGMILRSDVEKKRRR